MTARPFITDSGDRDATKVAGQTRVRRVRGFVLAVLTPQNAFYLMGLLFFYAINKSFTD